MEGTYPLPEAQLDRFLLKVIVPSPTEDELCEVLARTTGRAPPPPRASSTAKACWRFARCAATSPRRARRSGTRRGSCGRATPRRADAPEVARRALRYGGGVRGGQSLVLAAKAVALCDGRATCRSSDVRRVAKPALRHRLIRSFEGRPRASPPTPSSTRCSRPSRRDPQPSRPSVPGSRRAALEREIRPSRAALSSRRRCSWRAPGRDCAPHRPPRAPRRAPRPRATCRWTRARSSVPTPPLARAGSRSSRAWTTPDRRRPRAPSRSRRSGPAPTGAPLMKGASGRTRRSTCPRTRRPSSTYRCRLAAARTAHRVGHRGRRHRPRRDVALVSHGLRAAAGRRRSALAPRVVLRGWPMAPAWSPGRATEGPRRPRWASACPRSTRRRAIRCCPSGRRPTARPPSWSSRPSGSRTCRARSSRARGMGARGRHAGGLSHAPRGPSRGLADDTCRGAVATTAPPPIMMTLPGDPYEPAPDARRPQSLAALGPDAPSPKTTAARPPSGSSSRSHDAAHAHRGLRPVVRSCVRGSSVSRAATCGRARSAPRRPTASVRSTCSASTRRLARAGGRLDARPDARHGGRRLGPARARRLPPGGRRRSQRERLRGAASAGPEPELPPRARHRRALAGHLLGRRGTPALLARARALAPPRPVRVGAGRQRGLLRRGRAGGSRGQGLERTRAAPRPCGGGRRNVPGDRAPVPGAVREPDARDACARLRCVERPRGARDRLARAARARPPAWRRTVRRSRT